MELFIILEFISDVFIDLINFIPVLFLNSFSSLGQYLQQFIIIVSESYHRYSNIIATMIVSIIIGCSMSSMIRVLTFYLLVNFAEP